jgi:hypothetical protein
MNFQIGDRVRFLNETGEGIIRGINKQFATVEIEDGFDIPFLLAALVKIHEKEANTPPKTETVEPHKFAYDPIPESKISNSFSKAVTGDAVYLAFVPENENRLLSGPLLVYLINNTNYQIVYSCSLSKNNEDVGIAAGVLFQKTELLMQTINRHEIEKLAGIFVQLIFHNNIGFKARRPIQERIPLKSSFFTNIDKLKKLEGINKHAFVLPVYKDEPLPLYKPNIPTPAKKSTGFKTEAVTPIDSIFKLLNNEIEVDLHIEELCTYFSGMSNGEIVSMQLAHFHKCMDKAMASHVHAMIFIHGVGNGTLKRELRQELKNYKGVQVEDAPYEKYGSGATKVLFLH